MNRLHEKMVELMPLDEQSYYDREDKNAAIAGNVTGFHIPTKDRQPEEGLAYARMLSDTFSLTPGLLHDPALAWQEHCSERLYDDQDGKQIHRHPAASGRCTSRGTYFGHVSCEYSTRHEN